MQHSENTVELFKALANVRSKLKEPKKDRQGYGYNYADLAGVQGVINEAIKGTGIDYRQEVKNSKNGLPEVFTIITHTSGEYIVFGPLSLPTKKQDAQGFGSVITYARRYQLSAAFGIASEDDDDAKSGSQSRKNGNYTNPQNSNYVNRNYGNGGYQHNRNYR